MSRSLRIEYPNATYHVMNRGQGRANIFHSKQYTDVFLALLAETHQQFGLEVLSYCLMSNHYHLLLQTPRANLSRCMRHINSIYTQRHNKLRHTDGALFRGRYKAILVETDKYLLPVSRYIHRNPIETKTAMVKQLKDYSLSSYPAYIKEASTPEWLNTQLILSCMNSQEPQKAYQAYVQDSSASTLKNQYQKRPLPRILGEKSFISQIKKHALATDCEISGRQLLNTIQPPEVVNLVSKIFKIPAENIKASAKGRNSKNRERQIAMLLCKRHSGKSLPELAKYFNLTSYATVSKQTQRLLEEAKTKLEVAEMLSRVETQIAKHLF